MNSQLVKWLASSAGRECLTLAAEMPDDRLIRISRLRKLCTPEQSAEVVEQLILRSRGAVKFNNAHQMLFTSQGLEQSTGEGISRYRASRFDLGSPILDACCGIGGDALSLSLRAPVLAVDMDPATATCAAHNIATNLHQVQFPVYSLCADVTKLDLNKLSNNGFKQAFFDPGRRKVNRQDRSVRVTESEEYSPPLSWLTALQSAFDHVCVKAAPTIDDLTLAKYACRVEFVSERRECKEALLWPNDSNGKQPNSAHSREAESYTATVLDETGAAHSLNRQTLGALPITSPLSWIFEPDAAVVRAHLVQTLGAQLNASLISAESYYLTSDSSPTIPTHFALQYRVLDICSLNPTELQKRCVQLNLHVAAIKTRWTKLEPEPLLKRVKGADKRAQPVVIIVVPIGGKMKAILCEPPVT